MRAGAAVYRAGNTQLEIDRYPSELEDAFDLTDSVRLRVRALRRCEEGPIRELFARLSVRSRYLRFFSPFRTLPDAIVRRLACGDDVRDLALVAEHGEGATTEIVGLASVGATENGDAEVALVIRDDWQGRHVGTELARRLLAAAQQRGFCRFVAYVATGNAPIHRIIEKLGTVVSTRCDRGVCELAFERKR